MRDQRQAKRDAIREHPSLFCMDEPANEEQAGGRDADEEQPVVREELADRHQDDGRPGERLFHAGEDRRNFRHHEGHEEEQDGGADEEHEGRIDRGIRDLMLERQLFFQEFRQPEQNLIQRAAGLAGPHHMHIDRGKVFPVRFQDSAERLSSSDLFANIGEECFGGFLLGLIDQDAEGFDQWKSGHQECRKLSGHHREIVRGERCGTADPVSGLVAGPFLLPHSGLSLLHDIGRKDPFLSELQARDLDVFRVHDTGCRSAVVPVPSIMIDRHG